MRSALDGAPENFRKQLATCLKMPVWGINFAPSWGQALRGLLQNRKDRRRVVMVPVFNRSFKKVTFAASGYQIKLNDFSPKPGFFEWQKVIDAAGPSVSTLVITHYFGVPVDFRLAIKYAKAKGTAIIEDCAHTLGGKIAGRWAGTCSDAAIYSFNYDKPISLGWGGFALVNNPNLFDLTKPVKFRVPTKEEEIKLLKNFTAAMRWRRCMIRAENTLVLRSLRRLNLLNFSVFKKKADISIGAIQAELGRWSLEHYLGALKNRNATAKRISTSIFQDCWPVGDSVNPAWLKQKIRISCKKALRQASMKMQKQGVRLGNFNWPVLLENNQQKTIFLLLQMLRPIGLMCLFIRI